MAIRDLKQRLETQEGASGEALLKTLTTALNEVYGDAQGWQKFVGSQNKGLSVKGADSLWEETYKEILSESKNAVKAKKSDKAKEVLGDLISLTKDIAATEGVNAPIASGIQAMLDAVLPSIKLRIETLKKGEGIFKSMKKKAISSAAGAVESFASGLLAPLPFGAGEAIIGKAKGFLGGDKKERRGEQAMSFASRIEGGGIETSGAESSKEKGAGGKVAETLMGTGKEEGGIVSEKNLEETNDILRDILIAVSPDREALEEAKRKKEMLRQEDKGGKVKFGDKGWMKAVMSGVMAGAMIIGAIAAAVGALVMMVFDGIEGYFLAEEWGVSKTSAIIGSVIGGTGSGMSGAAWGAAKWGGAGFAIGMLAGGPVGAVIGGIAGMIIGAIAGFFGGEKIAKLIDEITSWVDKKWKALRVFLGVDTYSAPELAAQMKLEKEELDAQIEQQKQYVTALKESGGGATDYGAEATLNALKAKRAALNAPNALETQVKESTQKQKGLVATDTKIKEEGVFSSGGFMGMKFLFDAIPAMRDFLDPELREAVYGETSTDTPSRPQARGGIVTKPLYLPSSGIVVGEHPTYSGRGAYAGGLTSGIPDRKNESGMEAIIPLDQRGIDVMKKVVGRDLNDAAMDKIGYERGRGSMYEQPPTIIDNSTIQNVSNNTMIRSPSPSGQLMPGERGDFVSKIA
jgi:hypothetical protein